MPTVLLFGGWSLMKSRALFSVIKGGKDSVEESVDFEEATSWLVNWLCARLVDAARGGCSVESVRDLTQVRVENWDHSRSVGGMSECGRYVRLTRTHREGWEVYLLYRVLGERPATPAAFLNTMQASFVSPSGRGYLCTWAKVLAHQAMTDDKDKTTVAFAMRGAELEEAFNRVSMMSWQAVEREGELGCRRLNTRREQDQRRVKEMWRKEADEVRRRAFLGKELAPSFVREVMKEALITPIAGLRPSLQSKSLAPAVSAVLSRMPKEQREALEARFSLRPPKD